MDDDGKNVTAAQNARQLIADGVFLLFGSIEGGLSTAVAEVATELKVPFFGPMAGFRTLRRPHLAYVFPVRAEHREEFLRIDGLGQGDWHDKRRFLPVGYGGWQGTSGKRPPDCQRAWDEGRPDAVQERRQRRN